MSKSDHLALGAEFPPATYEQWRGLVERVLKGGRFEERLQSHTADDLTIEPLYARAKTDAPIGGRAARRWQVVQRVDHPNPTAANKQALEDLANGADALTLVFAGAIGAHGFGLSGNADDTARVLDAIPLGAGIALELDLAPFARDVPQRVGNAVKRRGIDPAATGIRFAYDPLTAMALSGAQPLPWSKLAPVMTGLVAALEHTGFKGPFAAADGRVVHNAGGSEAQELAYVIAAAVAYLRAFEAAGTAPDDARRMLFFRLTADADQFLTIAKLRALRMLWRRIEQSCGLAPEPIFISAETAWRTMTRDDPYVNILRATIATFAAGIGGADAITVLPFTLARGLPDRFARRLARNTSLVLLDEAHVAAVADPTAGTGWSEDLTAKLCQKAWTLFQEIEAIGGAAAALEQGLIQRNVASARAAREQALAEGKETLVGANGFRDTALAEVPVLDVARVEVPPVASPVESLRPIRFAEPFEQR